MLLNQYNVFTYRKRPYITRIGALSAPHFAPQISGEKPSLVKLLTSSCGGQMHE